MKKRPTVKSKLKLSLTAIALGHREASVVAPIYLKTGDWKKLREEVRERNLLQRSTGASSSRVLREIMQRLQCLQRETLEIFASATPEDQKAILLVAACKTYQFLFEFIVSSLKEKVVVFDFSVEPTDFDAFWNRTSVNDPGLDEISESTRKKIRQVTFRLLAEAGLISSTRFPRITPIPISPTLEKVLQIEGREYKSVFLNP